MNLLQKRNRIRLALEQLEDRCTPTITITSGMLPDANGNIFLTATTDGSNFNLTQTSATSFQFTDNGAVPANLTVNNVFGNITLNINTTNAALFSATFTTISTVNGNVTMTFGRNVNPNAGINFSRAATAASTTLGSESITTNTPGPSSLFYSPASSLTVLGNVTLNTNGAGATSATNNKQMNVGGAGAVQINGSLNATNVNDFNLLAGTTTIFGALNVTTKTNSVNSNDVLFGAGTTVGSLNFSLAATGGAGSNVVTMNGTVNTITQIRGNNGVDTITFDGFTSNGSSIIITGGNGNKTVNFNNTNSAPSAKLTVSVGNAVLNQVNFSAGTSLASATLVGGLGTNKVAGTVNFPLTLVRFAF